MTSTTIGRLVWKDIKVIQATSRRTMAAGLVVGALFIFRYYHWNVFGVYGFILASTVLVIHAVTEKNGLNEGLTASLPVSRLDIVSARYLSAALWFVLCLALWCLNGKAASLIFPDQARAYSLAFTAKGGFIAFVAAATMISLLLPAAFAFAKTGLILAGIASSVAAISTIPLLFRPYEYSYVHFFLPSDLPMVAITGSSVFLAVLASFLLAVRIYRTKSL